MKIEQVSTGLVFFGLIFAALLATAPNGGWVDGYAFFVDRTQQFIDFLLHILGVAALLKYLYSTKNTE